MNPTFLQQLADAYRYTELPLAKKKKLNISDALQKLNKHSLANEIVFYHLNEQFVSNKTRDIVFSTRIFGTLQTITIF